MCANGHERQDLLWRNISDQRLRLKQDSLNAITRLEALSYIQEEAFTRSRPTAIPNYADDLIIQRLKPITQMTSSS
jgi:hypothetical protein